MSLKFLSQLLTSSQRLCVDRRGVAAVEFAIVLPILALVLAGLIDFSRLASQRMQVRSAAQAGTDYVLRESWDESKVRQSITGATDLAISADPAPRLVRACLSGLELVEVATETCPSGAKAGTYVVASAQSTFRALMPWPGIAVPDVIHGSAFVRVQ